MTTNRRVVLAARPSGVPREEDFRIETAPLPQPGPNEVLVKNLWLSIDPYMRGRMDPGPSYARPLEIGGVMMGGTVGQVVQSNAPGVRIGDFVQGEGGWQEYGVMRIADATQFESGALPTWQLDPTAFEPRLSLSLLGMPGLTAFVGLRDIGQVRSADTVVISSAAGVVGSVAGQLAKRAGARVVGIAGGPDKCSFVERDLGFDACVDYKSPDFETALRSACPHGIDLYFDNVGGSVGDACMALINTQGRVVLCGQSAHYNMQELPPGPDRTVLLRIQILINRLTVRGLIVSDHWDRRDEFLREMVPLVRAGQVKLREDVVDGLDRAPRALIDLLQGRNFGKVLVRVQPAGE
jgi:NADPH-dependent curcumin reductase CurA